ncbi:MAG: hypothetical protein ACFFAH_09480 [Promethearchaeota archaeon]
MEEDKNTKIESELFALVNSINNLHVKYEEGTISESFFHKAIKNAMNGLLKIELFLREKNIPISTFLEKMNFLEEYDKAIKIIKNISDLEILNTSNGKVNGVLSPPTKKMRSYILELPGIASEITSSLITLIDALKLEGQSQYLMIRLLKELKTNFKKLKFPGLKDIQLKIKKIYKEGLKNSANLVNDNKFRERIANQLYAVLKEFQQKLSVKT